jgi:hypothetical protein
LLSIISSDVSKQKCRYISYLLPTNSPGDQSWGFSFAPSPQEVGYLFLPLFKPIINLLIASKYLNFHILNFLNGQIEMEIDWKIVEKLYPF